MENKEKITIKKLMTNQEIKRLIDKEIEKIDKEIDKMMSKLNPNMKRDTMFWGHELAWLNPNMKRDTMLWGHELACKGEVLIDLLNKIEKAENE